MIRGGGLLGEPVCKNKGGEEESKISSERRLGIPGMFVNSFFS